jgi:hypothetical protein
LQAKQRCWFAVCKTFWPAFFDGNSDVRRMLGFGENYSLQLTGTLLAKEFIGVQSRRKKATQI